MSRFGYLASKVRRAWSDGTLWDKSRRFLVTTARTPFEVLIGYTRLSRADRHLNLRDGFADHRRERDHRSPDPDHLRRIVAAYKASKTAQTHVELPFQVRGLWAEWVAINFKTLIAALESEDVATLSPLLENFYREQFTTGVGGYDAYRRYRSPLGSFYLKYVWSTYRKKLQSLDYDLENLQFPLVGNPAGVLHNGSVVSFEALRHAYHAVEMRELLRDGPRATIVEIGAGLGGQAYQAVRMNDGLVPRYLVFDIPEVAAISSYFLLSAFPDRSILLFGEGSVDAALSDTTDMAVLPHFAISQLEASSVDLFYNSCSFSEMDGATAKEYLTIIERSCRRFFLHDNHDTTLRFRNPDGSVSVNVIGSELIPDPALFKRVYKKPRVHGLPEDRSFPHFEYLYERLQA